MAEYFIELTAQDNGDNVVHKASCSLLPAKEALHYLGSIGSIESALKKANQTFKQVSGCPHCSTPSQETAKKWVKKGIVAELT